MEQSQLLDLARGAGFSHVGNLHMAALVLSPQVREMCAADRCGKYGRSWGCPPACGTLEEIAGRTAGYRRGILVQTTGALEDDFDLEGMRDIEANHKAQFQTLTRQLRLLFPHCLPMSSGACTLCRNCTYPHRPCRFPSKVFPSMEAYGLLVSDVCRRSGLPYYYGPQTMTYTACVLID